MEAMELRVRRYLAQYQAKLHGIGDQIKYYRTLTEGQDYGEEGYTLLSDLLDQARDLVLRIDTLEDLLRDL